MATVTKYPQTIQQPQANTKIDSNSGGCPCYYKQWTETANLKSGDVSRCGKPGTKHCTLGYHNTCPIAGSNGSFHTPARLELSNFKFNIPANSEIDKVVVSFRHRVYGVVVGTGKQVSGSQNAPKFSSVALKVSGADATTGSGIPTDNSWRTVTETFTGMSLNTVNSENFTLLIRYYRNESTNPGLIDIDNVKVTVHYTEPQAQLSIYSGNNQTVTTSTGDQCVTTFTHKIKCDNLTNCCNNISVKSKPTGTTITESSCASNIKTFTIKDKSGVAGSKSIVYQANDKTVTVNYIAKLPATPVMSIHNNITKNTTYQSNFFSKTSGCFETLNVYIDTVNSTPIIFTENTLTEAKKQELWNKIENLECGDHTLFIHNEGKEVQRLNFSLIPYNYDIQFDYNYPNGGDIGYQQVKNGTHTVKIKQVNTEGKSLSIDIIDPTFNQTQQVTLNNDVQHSHDINLHNSGTFTLSIKYDNGCSIIQKKYNLNIIPLHKQTYNKLFIQAEDGTSFDYKSLSVWEGDGVEYPILINDITKETSFDAIEIYGDHSTARILDTGIVNLRVKNNSDKKIENLLIELNLQKVVDGVYKSAYDEWNQNGIFKNILNEFEGANPDLDGLVSIMNLSEDDDFIGRENVYLKINEIYEDDIQIKLPYSSKIEKTIYLECLINGNHVNYIDNEDEEFSLLMISVTDPMVNTLLITGETDLNEKFSEECYETELTYTIYNDDDIELNNGDYRTLNIQNSPQMIPYKYITDSGFEGDIDFSISNEINIGENSLSKAIRRELNKEITLINSIINAEVTINGVTSLMRAKTNKNGIASFNFTVPDNQTNTFTIEEIVETYFNIYYKGNVEYNSTNNSNVSESKSDTRLEVLTTYKKYGPGDSVVIDVQLFANITYLKNQIIFQEPFKENKATITICYKMYNLKDDKGIFNTVFKTASPLLLDNSIRKDIFCGIDTDTKVTATLDSDILENSTFNNIKINLKNGAKKNKNVLVEIDLNDIDGVNNYDFSNININDGEYIINNNILTWYISHIDANTQLNSVIQLKAIEVGDSIINIRSYDYLHEKDDNNPFSEIQLKSNIINQKKRMIFEVDQESNFILPTQTSSFQIYLKNVSGTTIDNVLVKAINPAEIIINEGDKNQEYLLEEMYNNESFIINLDYTIKEPGIYYITFICYGENTGVYYENLEIYCNYTKPKKETEHNLIIYNFSPYEEHFMLSSEDFNSQTTKLVKYQHKPYKHHENHYKLIKNGELDSSDVLKYKNKDDLPIININRENYTVNILEKYKGSNFTELFEAINENSEYLRTKLLRTGTNVFEKTLQPMYPNGFIHRFGLLRSEIFHHTGVIPEFSHMSDRLFKWDASALPQRNIWPELKKSYWNTKVWAGDVYYVWEYYDDKDNNIHNKKRIASFPNLEDAKSFVEREETYNEFDNIEHLSYEIKPGFWDAGVFFMEIPLRDIPPNFFLLDYEELYAIMQKTKPLGMKGLIRYLITATFDNTLTFSSKTIRKPTFVFDIGDFSKITYLIKSLKYNLNTNAFEEHGLTVYNGPEYNLDYSFDFNIPAINNCHTNNLDLDFETSVDIVDTLSDLSYTSKNLDGILATNSSLNLSYYKKRSDSINLLSGINCVFELTNGMLPDIRFQDYQKCDLSFTDEDTIRINGAACDSIVLNNPNNIFGAEFGFYIQSKGVNHLLSFEYDNILNSNNIYQKTIVDESVMLKNNIISDLNQIMIEVRKYNGEYIVIMYYEKDGNYYYFTHITLQRIDGVGIFLKNNTLLQEEKTINIGNLLFADIKELNKITFNIPQYKNKTVLNSEVFDYTQDNSGLKWSNLYRIDENNTTYTLVKNDDKETSSVSNIFLNGSDLNIPHSAIIEDIILKINNKTNKESINANIKLFNNTKNHICKPTLIESYKENSLSQKDIDYNINLAQKNKNANKEKYYKEMKEQQKKISDMFKYNLNFINYDKPPLTIKNNYWVQFENINIDNSITLDNVSEINLIIEGYSYNNYKLLTQSTFTNIKNKKVNIDLKKGYFYEKTNLPLGNFTSLKDLGFRFKAFGLNVHLELFDVKVEIVLKDSIKYNNNHMIFDDNIKLLNSDNYISLLNKPLKANEFDGGIGVLLNYDKISINDFIRIYGLNVQILYRNLESELNIEELEISSEDEISIIGSDFTYISGEVFDEDVMIIQDNVTVNDNGNYIYGVQLSDTVYQSFSPNKENITSVEFLTNGYKGSPSSKIKLSILEDNYGVPGKSIKEIYVNGWDKNQDSIKYNIYQDKLDINKIYWIKLELVEKSKDSYYYLRFFNNFDKVGKMLYETNGDLKNLNDGKSCLAFTINSTGTRKVFNSVPFNNDGIDNPFVNLKINTKNQDSVINNLKIKRRV